MDLQRDSYNAVLLWDPLDARTAAGHAVKRLSTNEPTQRYFHVEST